MEKAYIILSDGQVFEGLSFGARGESVGELVFTTGMGGYIETLTDPSYSGQIIMQTFPLIGNYGTIEDDAEAARPAARGYVVREWCDGPSNFRSGGDIDAYLKTHGIVGVCGVDTREITRIIRERGVMNAKLATNIDDKQAALAELAAFSITGAVAGVSSAGREVFPPEGRAKYRVALIDYGAKRGIVRELRARGCEVTVLHYDTSAAEIIGLAPDGLMLSNGPGDPADNPECIAVLRGLAGRLPILGICLGHQLLALALGAKTEKLKYGHRGVNQPVKDIATGRVYITSQNHGYAVCPDTLPACGSLRLVNANDGTCEGIDYPDIGAFSVQFHPEGSSGPRDTGFLFDRFAQLMDRAGGRAYAEG